MKSTEATDTPQPPPAVRPRRPTFSPSSSVDDTVRYHDAMNVYRAEVEAFDEAESARALAAGRAVYDRFVEAEVEVEEDPDRRTRIVCITPEDFCNFRVWCRAHGVHCPECPASMEFKWFGGAVLVVVR